jgi:Tol biopolymer transport system component
MRAISHLPRVRASAVLAVGLAGFAIYVISCVHSPVSWSPDSSKIALTVMPTDDDVEVMGIFTYDIDSGERRVIDTMTEGGILSGPAWSPDGKWLAYYRVRPEEEGAGQTAGASAAGGGSGERPAVSDLFTEDNRIQPAFVFAAGQDLLDEDPDAQTLDVELVVVSADGKARKAGRVLRWLGDKDTRSNVLVLRPRWSADSQRVFYMRTLDKMGYVGSLDIATGRMEAHLFTSSTYWDVSPDGAWVAACLDDALALSRADGSAGRYLRVLTEEEAGEGDRPLAWAPDSRRVGVFLRTGFMVVDIETGAARRYRDATAEEIGHLTFAADGTKVYYVAKYRPEGGDEGEKAAAIRAMDLGSEKVETVTLLPEIDADVDETLGAFSVSPDGRMFLVRAVVSDEAGKKASCLIFWDGRKRRVVETESWLEPPAPKTGAADLSGTPAAS